MKKKQELTAKEAAEKLDVSRSIITKYCRDGKFPNARKDTDRFGSEFWLIPVSDLNGVVISMGRPKKTD